MNNKKHYYEDNNKFINTMKQKQREDDPVLGVRGVVAMVTSSLIYASFCIYFLFFQLVTVSQSAPSPLVSYSPPARQKLQKCPPCPLVKERSLNDKNKTFFLSKSLCPPQTGKCLPGHVVAVVVNRAAVAVANLAVVVAVGLAAVAADHVAAVAGLVVAAVHCCGCKRHRRNGCTATTIKMVDVLPTPPILMKLKSK
uniref:LITAF domain-containing protein n=1 Tax=Meloidogyne hapla TaxID=6305 RepID=A0A1I8BR63_MELHA